MTTTQFLVAYAIGAVAGAAVFLHADKHGNRHPTAWAITVFLFPIAVLGYVYTVRRARRGRRF